MEDWTDKIDQENMLCRLITMPSDLRKLAQYGEIRKFPKGYVLEKAGTKPNYCYIVKSGRVVGYEYTPNGEERDYYINEANSILLEGNVMFDYICPVNFRTAGTAELVLLNKNALLHALSEDFSITMNIMQSLTLKMLTGMNIVRQSNFHSVTWKICELLMNYAQHYGVPYDGKILIQEKISQQLISNLLGVNRVTVVRSVNTLKDIGLIEIINGYYCIRSIEKMQRYQDSLLFSQS